MAEPCAMPDCTFTAEAMNTDGQPMCFYHAPELRCESTRDNGALRCWLAKNHDGFHNSYLVRWN